MPYMVEDRIDLFVPIFKSLSRKYETNIDRFTNPKFYPEEPASPRIVAMYFLVMVSQDHRLSRPGRPYEAVIDGEKLHGADLLYRLGIKKLKSDPEFFNAKNLSEITTDGVSSWLCIDGVCPPDIEIRTSLIRDLGRKLLKLYNGDPLEILRRCRARLRGTPDKPGFLDLLRVFMAYNDPVEKKSYLLAKFLERRGIIKFIDVENKRVPVDNHLTRIALRLGIVELENFLKWKLLRRAKFEIQEDIMLRICIRETWYKLAKNAGIDPFILDDILWSFGRSICIAGTPKCNACDKGLYCVDGKCVFRDLCRAYNTKTFVNEHVFYDTWWY